jgi:hypothetical protein
MLPVVSVCLRDGGCPIPQSCLVELLANARNGQINDE